MIVGRHSALRELLILRVLRRKGGLELLLHLELRSVSEFDALNDGVLGHLLVALAVKLLLLFHVLGDLLTSGCL